MDIDQYRAYVARFNAADRSAFVENMAPDVVLHNGALFLRGVAAVLAHYEQRIWPWFLETVNIEHIIANADTLAVKMWTHFVATRNGETLFGKVLEGDCFDYRGLVMYTIGADGRFTYVQVAYNSFASTPLVGPTRELGMPH